MKGRVAEVGSSSLRPTIYKQLTLLAMLLALPPFTKPRKPGYIERSNVEIHDVLRKRLTQSLVKNGSMFHPKLNVLDNKSLLLDHPLEGGNLGY